MPTIGLGALHDQPKEVELFDTDKEKNLFKPRNKTWGEIGEEGAVAGVGINMVLAPTKFIDVGSIGMVPSVKVKLSLRLACRCCRLDNWRRNIFPPTL